MELTLTVHVPRRRPRPVDVVVEWSGRHTADQLCVALSEHLQVPVPGLAIDGRAVEASAVVGMPPLLHGASVVVTTASRGAVVPAPHGVLELVVVGGPDAGRSRPLVPPGFAVGRAAVGGFVIDDDALSRVHAEFRVGPGGVTVEDAGSTNGVVVDGCPVAAAVAVAVDTGSSVVMGASTLRLRRVTGAGAPPGRPGDGRLVVRPSAAEEQPSPVEEVECPPAPAERVRARIPWVAALAPVPVAGALAVFLGPQLLAFALLGPFVLLATAAADRWGSGRARRRDLEAHAAAVAAARARLAHALARESARLQRLHPDPHTVLATAEHRLPTLWSRPPRVTVRLGLGDVPTRVVWVEGTTRTRPQVRGAPVVVDLEAVGCLGVVGGSAVGERFLAGLVGQLCTALPPHRLSVAVDGRNPSWEWVRRLPHAVGTEELLAVGDSEERGGSAVPAGPQPCRAALGHRVLVLPDAASVGTHLARARQAGALVLLAVSDIGQVPAGCRAVVTRAQGADRYVLDTGDARVEVTVDLVGAWWVDRLSRALAPLTVEAGTTGRRLPTTVSLCEALLVEGITEEYVLSRWAGPGAGHHEARRHAATRAVVGVRADGAFAVDLVRDGPHVLVGGTTGSGKSEFLRTLVTSLALSCPPQDLSLVLVDFKGGAAFGSCAGLPHVVGLVTDLDEHLVSRALSSLGAELRRRERLFATVGARELDDYRRLAGPGGEPVPRLVVVVDELRALVDEVPEFVHGLVRLAALGRSLGVHLVLATQRPAGVVTAEIQANVNLRIAFRVRDRADSVDVLDDPAAGRIGSDTPGRGLCRGGDGSLVEFQAATVSGPGNGGEPHLTVRRSGVAAARADTRAVDGTAVDAAAVDAASSSAAVEAIRAAHRRTGGTTPASPWLPPLPQHVAWAPAPRPVPGSSTALPVGLVDEPDRQRMPPLLWSPVDGTWLLVGRPGSGRTTALRSIVLTAVSAHDARHLHVHVVDPTRALTDLTRLPHLGAHVGPDDHRAALDDLVHHLRQEVDHRAGEGACEPGSGPWPTLLVVVDGWEQVVETQPTSDPDGLPARLMSVLRDGRSVGVLGAVAGGRTLLQPRWTTIAGRTFLLGAADPLDAALAGLRASDLARDPPPGRAVRVHDRREVQFTAASAGDVEQVAGHAGPRPDDGGPWRRVPLPAVVRPEQVRPRACGPGAAGSDGDAELPLALTGPSLEVWSWRHEEQGRRVLVAGPAGSGRTTVLRAMASAAGGAGRAVVLVTDRLGRPDDATGFAGAAVLGPGDVDALVALRRRHPGLLLLVDDADRLDDAAVLPALREIVDLVDRDRGLVAVATTTAALVTRFRGLGVEVARHRSGILLNPGPHDGELLGARGADEPPRLPGRGLAVSRGRAREIQVVLVAASAGAATAGLTAPVVGVPGAEARQGRPWEHLAVGVPGDPGREDRHDGHDDDQPADHDAGALDQAQPDRKQERAPHDGRRPWPGPLPEPAPGQQQEGDRADEDEQGGHHHPGGVTALPDEQLVDVERREAHERHALRTDEQGGEAAGAA